MPFIRLRGSLLFLMYWEFLSWVLDFVKWFFHVYWNGHLVFVLYSVNIVYYITGFWMLNCSPGMNPTWSSCMSFFMCCWIQFANILLRIFVSVFMRDIDLYFSCDVFIWLWCEGSTGLIEWVGKFLSSVFLRVCEGLVISFLQIVDRFCQQILRFCERVFN